MIGQQVHSFEIKKLLGEGGMASVYLGENKIGKKVAVKVLHTKYFYEDHVRARFIQEASIMAKLQHKHICSAIDLEDCADYSAIIMDYMEGEDLDEYVKKRGKVDEATVWSWLSQMADALDYAHLARIVHRDLKPSNFFLTNDGDIKVMDFGIAKAAESAVKTGTGMQMGSATYMSPEQIKSAKYVDYRTDLYSLGVTLYTLLNGQSPYVGIEDSLFEIMKRVEGEPLPKLLGLSREMQELLDLLLSKSMEDRRIELGGLSDKVQDIQERGGGSKPPDGIKPIDRPPSDDTRVSGDSPNSGSGSGGGGGQKKRRVAEVKEKKGMGPMVWVLLLIVGIIVGVVYIVNEQQERERARQEQADAVAQAEDAEQAKQAQAKQEKARQDKARKAKARQAQAKKDKVKKRQADAAAQAEREEKARQDKARKAQAKPLTWITVEGGEYEMGCKAGRDDINGHKCYDSEKPLHRVRVGSFKMSQYEVTNAQYAKFMNAIGVGSDGTYGKGGEYENKAYIDMSDEDCQISYSGGRFVSKGGYEHYPVVMVSWYGARNYAKWVGGRLPTEEEWEYAARGGNKSKGYQFAGSNEVEDVAWYNENSGDKTHAVGGKSANELGLYDMNGNVWEWCESQWSDDYNSTRGGSNRVIRGRSWNNNARNVRVSDRNSNYPTNTFNTCGFRPVLSL